MARVRDRLEPLNAASHWINTCLIEDGSIFSDAALWSGDLVEAVRSAFVDHPDEGSDDFITKLKGQMDSSSSEAKQLMAEMLWALLLFPSNIKPPTKRRQIRDLWKLSGQEIPSDHAMLEDNILKGIGSGGPGFNNYRPQELTFLIALTQRLKTKPRDERRHIFGDYDSFVDWINSVPQTGNRQFRHMLRYFSFPDLVERMSSNNDRRSILEGLGVESKLETRNWTDKQLDEALQKLRAEQTIGKPDPDEFDFYLIKEKWSPSYQVRTDGGLLSVAIPDDEDELEVAPEDDTDTEVRQSFKVQAALAEVGAAMGYKVWIPRPDRGRVSSILSADARDALINDLPLSYDRTTLHTIELIDVLWLDRRSIARAFEVEHTTSVFSGLLRMADLISLQSNMDIKLHIVAPSERRDKVFKEMNRPVFALLSRGPLSDCCKFISYDAVDELRNLRHLSHLSGSVIEEYQEEEVE